MFYYLLIGLIVQCIITLSRVARGVTSSLDSMSFSEWVVFTAVFVGGAIFNVLTWPIAIVCEIINIKKGV